MVRRIAMRAVACGSLFAAVAACIAWVAAPPTAPPKQLVLIVAGPTADDEALAAGARAAAQEQGVDLRVEIPSRRADLRAQTELLARVKQQRPDGVALCPVRPHDQVSQIDDLSASTHLVLCRSDAPSTQRRSYVGAGDYATGRVGAQAVRRLVPSGGDVVVFYDDCSPSHALRLEGLHQALHESQPLQCAPLCSVAAHAVGRSAAEFKSVLQRVLADHADLKWLVCFSARQSDLAASMLANMEKTGVKIVAFEPTEGTFAALEAGRIDAVVADDPYQIGYFAVTHLAAICRYNARELPVAGRGSVFIRSQVVTRGDLAAFRAGRRAQSDAVLF
jgi:ribose transport system substrate-binding protein